MKVLLTNLTLATRTGTEIVTRDLAFGLLRAGHEPCVFSPLHGNIAGELIEGGIPVVARLEDVPFRPDIIHGHHHVETTLALTHFRSVPAIFVCHDRLNWHDTPPKLDGVRRYVAVDRNCLERLVMEAGISSERTRLILNAVDLRRFRLRGPLPKKPRRALVFSNYVKEGAALEMLRRVCGEAGMELAVAGLGAGAQASRPEEILGDYDLVFAKARCALEALAAGCAVILCDAQTLGPSVSSGELQELREWNFGMRCLQQRLTPDSVAAEIARYDAADAGRVARLVRDDASLDAAIAQYMRVYEEAIAESGSVCVSVADAVETLARNTGSLESLLRNVRQPFTMPPVPKQVTAGVEIRLVCAPGRIPIGASVGVAVEIENSSREVLASVPPYPVQLAYHWLEPSTRRCVVFDGERTALSLPVNPRSRHRQEMRVVAPSEPGRYLLVLTMVQEGRFWFDRVSRSAACEREVTVAGFDGEAPGESTLAEVARQMSARVICDGSFANLGFLSDPQERMLTFVEAPRFVAAALACAEVACVLTKPELSDAFPQGTPVAVAENPKHCFFELHNRLATETEFYGRDFDSLIDESARLHPRCWVDEKNVIIGPGVVVGPNASITGRAIVGERAEIHAGAVIGSAGFQTSSRRGDGIEMAHAGATEIGADCHVLANAVIARGLFRQSTRIGRACRIGNNAFVSHNSVLEDGVFVGHGAVVNGNVKIGANAWIGPGATIVHNIAIGEGAEVSLGATVIRNVEPGKRVTGSLAMEHRKMLRFLAAADKTRER